MSKLVYNNMQIDTSGAPYYDRYDVPEVGERDKHYTQLLARPGQVAQAREITQIQSTLRDMIKSVGDSIFKDGNTVEGCQVIIAEDKKSVTVTSGRVYIRGMVLPVAETTLNITGVGEETIGFKLVETLITEVEDSTLRDPALGYDNYDQPGCHRIKSDVIIVKDDPDSAILSTLIDGDLYIDKYAPNYDIMTQTLARRTYDESGSYIVEGLNVRVEDYTPPVADATASNYINVVIESGKAYVLGYELKIPAPRRIKIPRSLSTRVYTANHISYAGGDNTIISDTPYIESLQSVIGTLQKIETPTVSQNNSADIQLGNNTAYKLKSVVQGSTTFKIGVDCSLYIDTGSGNTCYLRWSSDTENLPVAGSSINITYYYEHTFKDTDYELVTTGDTQSIYWKSTTKPIVASDAQNLKITYNLYLARKDIVYIDQYGNIDVLQGTPSNYGFEEIPEAPVNTLVLAYIMSPPNGDVSINPSTKIVVSNVGLTRFTMNDIQRLLNRIRTLEYNQTILSLNDEAKNHKTTNDKKGILTDPLIDVSKVELYYNLADGATINPGLPIYSSTIDLESNICYLSTKRSVLDFTYDAEDSTSTRIGRVATLKKVDESVVLSQLSATKSFLINPYSMYPQTPEISIDPAVDFWIDDNIITIPVSQQSSQIVETSTDTVRHNMSRGRNRTNTTVTDTVVGTTVEVRTDESVVSEEAITYMRPKTINVVGSYFLPGTESDYNIKGYFDGIPVDLTPTGTTQAGSTAGTIKADSNGNFTAQFTIPERILTGIREFRVEANYNVSGYVNSAFALYQASGTLRTINRTVTTLTTVLLNRVTTIDKFVNVDPVGQTFVLDQMTLISGIDLYFEAKPTNNVPVTCEIREVVNGTITSTVYGHKTLTASDVIISSDSSKPTRFTFDTPVLLEADKEYAFVVRSTSTSYRLWISELGENDITTGNPVVSNPYLIGVMLSSSNNSSWTTHQTSDIKFRLISDNYSRTAEIVFSNVETEEGYEFSNMMLLADAVVPNGTSLEWYYSVDGGSTYTKVTPYSMNVLKSLNSQLKFKALLSRSTDTRLSPIVAIDAVAASVFKYKNPDGWYITKKIPVGLSDSTYTNVDIILDTYTPTGTEIKVYVSNKGNLEDDVLEEATIQEHTAADNLSYGWTVSTYKATVSAATNCRIFIKLSSSNGAISPAFRKMRAIMS